MLSEYLKNLTTFQKVKYGIILLYFALNLTFLILSLNMSTDNLKLMIKMGKYSYYMRYFALLAMALFFTIVAMYYSELRSLKRRNAQADEEITRLKSKLYDRGIGKGESNNSDATD